MCGFFCLCVLGLPGPADVLAEQGAPRQITVDLVSGRRFTAWADPRTDQHRLWLRWKRESASVVRPIEWRRVVQAHVAGERLSGEQLQAVVAEIRKQFPASPGPIDTVRRISMRMVASPVDASIPETIATAPDSPQPPPSVRSLAIQARLTNWDSDVEMDGLLVEVYPLDADGAPVAVHGTIHFELMGQRYSSPGRGEPFSRPGTWTRRVRPADFSGGTARYRLPFGQSHPEFDTRVAPHGALHARLCVSGQGVFETTDSLLRIRPYSAVRDRLEQATGRRFFWQERTSRPGR